MDVKRLEQEKEREDIFKKRFQSAEEEQKRQMKAFEKAAQESKEERERILKVKDDMLKESMKAQDESKKRHLQAFDKIAQKGGGTIMFFLDCFSKNKNDMIWAHYFPNKTQISKFNVLSLMCFVELFEDNNFRFLLNLTLIFVREIMMYFHSTKIMLIK